MATENLVTISAKAGKDGTPVSVQYDLPKAGDLAGLTERFTEDIVARHARGSIVVSLQGYVRGLITAKDDKGKPSYDAAAIQKLVDEWLPSTRQPGKSKVEKTTELFLQLSEDEKKELLASLG